MLFVEGGLLPSQKNIPECLNAIRDSIDFMLIHEGRSFWSLRWLKYGYIIALLTEKLPTQLNCCYMIHSGHLPETQALFTKLFRFICLLVDLMYELCVNVIRTF